MNDMEDNKCEELQQQIEDKEKQIEVLQNDIQKLEAIIEQHRGRFANILEKANTLVNKYYLDYNSYFDEFYFCYCKNANKVSTGITIENKFVEIELSNSIRFYEINTTSVVSMEFFDKIIILNEKQIEEIYDKINKTIRGEQTVEDLYCDLKELYNAEKA